MATVKQLLDWHRDQLGFVEGPRNNETPYAKQAGHANFLAWCATYQVAGARAVSLKLPSESPYTPAMLNGFKAEGRVINKPKVGAFAFLYFSSLRRVAHVGIVEQVLSDGRFVTIEGNTDSAGGRTGGRVMRKVRSQSGWTFAMPEYDKPKLNKVQKIQRRLEVSRDGKWGPRTDARALMMRTAARSRAGRPNIKKAFDVREVQRVVDTPADGIWGPKSQDKLHQWIKSLQRVLGVPANGYWNARTDREFLKFRKNHIMR